MKPRGPLMIEHRLIERMIETIRKEVSDITASNKVDPAFIDTVVDFIRVYADRTHHGKEEDILFRDCARKNMSEQDKRIMDELVEEHKLSRRTIGQLLEAKNDYIRGEQTAAVILEKLNTLVDLYPRHIEKEDKVFFPNSEKYFTEEEQQRMLEEFREFDKNMIHEKYKSVVDNLRND